jgi:DNA sulfur modification protein DndD
LLIKSIKLHNFRQFAGDNSLLFSTDNLANVSVIMGDNASGKTTLAQAFTWCLYGNTDFQNKSMLSLSVANNMVFGEVEETHVEIELIQKEREYRILTKQKYKKDDNGKVVNSTQVVRSVTYKTEAGQTELIPETKTDFRINEILPRELSRYFFFDGERIDKMSKEIRQGKSKEFSEAVKGLLGLSAYKAALEHLNGRSSSSVIRNYNSSFDSKSDSKIAQLMSDIENLDNEIDKINTRLGEIDEQKDFATDKCKELREIIIKNEEGEKLQQDYDRYQEKLKILERNNIETKGQILKSFTGNAQRFFSIKIIFNILQLLSNNEKLDKGIPDIHKRTIDFLIKRGYCICGTKLEDDSEAHRALMDILNYIPPNSIGSSINQFVRECGLSSEAGFSLFENVENNFRFLRNYDNEYFEIEENIKALKQKLENIKDISQYQRDLTIYESQIRKLDSVPDAHLIRKSNLESEKTHKETERDQLALRDENNKNIETYRAYAQYTYSILEKEYAEKEKKTRETLEQEINEIFNNIFNGGISLELDDTYHISIKINETFDDSDTSTGQNFTVIFAFISGIIKMAKTMNIKEMVSTEPYPLVMDAPLSSFDKKRIEKICNTLPEIAEQIIIFIKDTDGEYAEKYMTNKIGKRYELEKINEIETIIRENK